MTVCYDKRSVRGRVVADDVWCGQRETKYLVSGGLVAYKRRMWRRSINVVAQIWQWRSVMKRIRRSVSVMTSIGSVSAAAGVAMA